MSSSPAPSIEHLTRLRDQIDDALAGYRNAESSDSKVAALNILAGSARHLTRAAAQPQATFFDFCFQPLGNACIRIALAVNLFDHLDASEARTSDDIAKRTGSDPKLTLRLLRTLSALDFVREDGKDGYLHTPLSQIYTQPAQRAYAIWMFDVMAKTGMSVGDFFGQGKFEDGSEYHPFNFAHGEEAGKDVFQIVREMGKAQLLLDAMGGSGLLLAKETAAIYPFDKLEVEDGGTVLVDVGGNRGETLMEVRKVHPDLKGNVVLQDLQSVLDGGVVEGLHAQAQGYDFFKETQPVIGASAYLYQRIFHDWGFDPSRLILQSLKPAMRPHSKLLISEIVVEDHVPQARKTLRDMNMLLIGGMERSESQWKQLLESEGFYIVKIHGLENDNHSVIEAALRAP